MSEHSRSESGDANRPEDALHEHGHHAHAHGHGHGHEHDQGFTAMLRYARFARRMWTSEINDAVVARLAPKPGETVIDIGAGVGAGTMVAAAAGAKVMAVEPTPYMRRILNWRRAASSRRDLVTVVDGSAEATGVANGSANGVWAVNTMHHWVDVDVALGELVRIVAPGGRVLLVDEDFDDPSHPDYESMAERRARHSHQFDAADPAAIADRLGAAGFTIGQAGKDTLIGRPVVLVEATKHA